MSNTMMVDADPRLKHPCNISLAGPTQVGKSYLAAQLIEKKDRIFNPVPANVIWCYALWQPLYDTLKDKGLVNEFVQGIDGYKEYLKGDVGNLVIIDDLQREAQETDAVASMFERGGHHENVSIMYITQNIFHQGKKCRDINLNCHYLFLFKNKRDMSQITTLARQVAPGKTKFVQEAYDIACSSPHGYLMFDFHHQSHPDLKYRTDLLCLANDQEDSCCCTVFTLNKD